MANRPLTAAGRVIVSFILLAFMALGGLLTIFFVRDIAKITRSWKPAPCVILQSSVEESQFGDTYRPALRFEYQWEGKTFVSSQFRLRPPRDGDYSSALRVAHRYPQGSARTCRVNPHQPNEAILEMNSFFAALGGLIPFLFVPIGAAGLYFLWRRNPNAGLTLRHSPKSQAAPILIGAGFFIAGLLLFIFLAGIPLVKIISARHWNAVPCEVISSKVSSSGDGRRITYRVNILYSYRVNDQEYRSNRYKFMPVATSGRDRKHAIIQKYPDHLQTTCFVNPADPYDAVLNREFTADILFGLFPLAFMAAGGLVLLVALKTRKRKGATSPASDDLATR